MGDLTINMWQATLVGGAWVVSKTPAVSFIYNGLRNLNWGFRDTGAEAPGCGVHKFTAYCAFSANQVGAGKAESTPAVYLATVHVGGGAAAQVVRVNDDALNGQKHHFFAWATTTPAGAVYVGWYDDRRDPADGAVHAAWSDTRDAASMQI